MRLALCILFTLTTSPLSTIASQSQPSSTIDEKQNYQTELATAILENDVDRVRTLMFGRDNPNEHIHINVIRLLKINDHLETERSKTKFFQSSTTPLILAASLHNDPQVISVLLEAGANPNATGWSSQTALIVNATHTGSVSVARALLDHGADANLANAGGATPLMTACKYNQPLDYIHTLLKADADPNASTRTTQVSPLIEAAKNHSDPDVISLLVGYGANIHAEATSGATATGMACAWNNNIKIIHRLISLGGDINHGNNIERTGVIFAAMYNTAEIMRFLILNGAAINQADDEGFTALAIAAASNKPNVVTELIKAGAILESRDNKGLTPFQHACRSNCPEMVLTLLDAGAKLETRDEDGCTPLLIACKRNNLEMVRTLLEVGAEPRTTDYNGWNGIDYATVYNWNENAGLIVKLMEKLKAP